MNSDITYTDFSTSLFWDIDLNDFDFIKHKNFFICRVLEYGHLYDWQLIKKIYSEDEIKNAVVNARSLDVVSLAYVSAYYKLDKKDFRCYKHKQLFPNSWNS